MFRLLNLLGQGMVLLALAVAALAVTIGAHLAGHSMVAVFAFVAMMLFSTAALLALFPAVRRSPLAAAAVVLAMFAIVTNPGTRSFAQNVRNYMDQGGAFWHVGGTLQIESGGVLNIAAGGAIQFGGTATDIKTGQKTTASASDTVVTGLTTVTACVANLDSAPTTDPEIATCSIGDQAGSPAAGSILIQTWKTFGGTPAAATTFSKKANWVAIGN